MRPSIFQNQSELSTFIDDNGLTNVKQKDLLQDQLVELKEICFGDLPEDLARDVWVYLPWDNTAYHMVAKAGYELLRTNRNQNLITQEEHTKLQINIGVCGLSVGSTIAYELAHQSIGKELRLADFDTVDTTNLNRMRASVSDIGKTKLEILCQSVSALDPFLSVVEYPNGVDGNNIDDFITRPEKLDVVFEEIDNLGMKLMLRQKCKQHKVAFVMMTNMGDSVLIDVERYDIDPEAEPFNGKVSQDDIGLLASGKKLAPADFQRIAVAIVGKDNIPQRAIESLMEIGKSLVGRPQLAGTVSISAGLATYITRQIILDKFSSGSYRLQFNKLEQL